MPAAIPIAMVASSAISGALARKGSSTQTSSTMPQVDPVYGGLRDILLKNATSRLTSGGLPEGYETGGVRNINHTYDLIGQNQQNSLTARGLGTSPIAGAVDASRNLGRAGQIADFQTNLPLVQRQLQNEDFGMANNLLSHGYGSTSTGTQNYSQGGGASGAFSDVGSMLGFLMASGAFKPQGNGLPGYSAGPF